MKQKCPYCESEYKHIINHISIVHDITNMDRVAVQVSLMEEEDIKRENFKEFVKEINTKLSKGEITGEDYRKEVKIWNDQKKWKN